MKSIQELEDRRAKALDEMNSCKCDGKTKILVGVATCGIKAGANEIMEAIKAEISAQGISDVEVEGTGCVGMCSLEPIVEVISKSGDKTTYGKVTKEVAAQIVKEHVMNNNVVSANEINSFDFFKRQTRVAMKNCGVINPTSLDEYIAMDGYKALSKVLTEMKPEDVIKEIEISGLRGRGGSGFPTFKKWTFAANTQAVTKYIVCNADEGDLGAFMDRGIIEGDPHCILEAMMIAAYAVKANKGYIYCRIEYPLAQERFNLAIKQAYENGLLGENILGTGFNFDIELRMGAGAYVCGEETALISSLEGKRGEPKLRPPFPPISGLNGKPTVLNNVETLANIPRIILGGGQWYKSIGMPNCAGTKVFSLGGKVNNIGLVEVPMGITMRELVYDIGGGVSTGKKLKGVQTSGGFIPMEKIDMPLDFDSMAALNSMLGSGGIVVIDEDDSMVDLARFIMEFMVEESCGKCTACRVGTTRMLEILESICEGKAEMSDLDVLYNLANSVKAASFCGLGQFAPNPVLYSLNYFRNEFEDMINKAN